MLQPLRVSHRPVGGLITPAELRQALETMEAQHKSIETQVAMKTAQVEALVAQRTSFDVNFVSLQLETGTGTQLFARVHEKLDDLGASQRKVAVAAMDAVRWLVRLGYHAKGLEELYASQDDEPSSSRLAALHDISSGLKETAALLELRKLDLEGAALEVVAEYWEDRAARDAIDSQCHDVTTHVTSNAKAHKSRALELEATQQLLLTADGDFARASQTCKAAERDLAMLLAEGLTPGATELLELNERRLAAERESVALAEDTSAADCELAEQELGSLADLIAGAEAELARVQEHTARAGRELDDASKDLAQLQHATADVRSAVSEVAVELADLSRRVHATAEAQAEAPLVDAQYRGYMGAIAVLAETSDNIALDADLIGHMSSSLSDLQTTALDAFTDPLLQARDAATASAGQLGVVLCRLAPSVSSELQVQCGAVSVQGQQPAVQGALSSPHDALVKQLADCADHAHAALASAIACCSGLPEQLVDAAGNSAEVLAVASRSVVLAMRGGALHSAQLALEQALTDLGVLGELCGLGDALSSEATLAASLRDMLKESAENLSNAVQAKGAFDEAIVLSTNDQERNTSAVQAAMSEVKRLLEEKLTELAASSSAKIVEMKARYALGAQKTALDTESAAAALREEASTLLGLTTSVSHMAAELVDCGRAVDALDAKVAALEMLPIVQAEVQGYARASSAVPSTFDVAALQLAARTPVDTHSHKRHLPHSPFFDEELGDEESAAVSSRRGPVAWHDEQLAGPAERLAHQSDRGGRKSVRFTAGAKADPAGSYETAPAPRETRKSVRAPEILPAMSVPRGSSPSSEPMHGRNAAAGYHSAESMPPPRYGQALLAYTAVVGGGSGSGGPASGGLSKKLTAPRASIASERPHFGRGPVSSSAASAPYLGGRIAGAPIARLAVADDDSQSVASQGSLFGSKLVATRF